VLVADPPFERSVSQLWSYCGHGDPTRRRRKGMTADDAAAMGNPALKTAVWQIAVACTKQVGTARSRRSPYRDVYDVARLTYADRDWTDAHRHAAALRKVGKEILRDLWKVA
jgi:hypothetical protein